MRSTPLRRFAALLVAFAPAFAVAACPSATPVAVPPPTVGSTSASVAVEPGPLGEVTLQSALEAAWDGDYLLCYKRGRTALSIASDDLETMELTMRCAHAQKVLPEAVGWVRSAYSVRLGAPVVRYGLAIASYLRGELGDSKKALEKLAADAPVAAYQAALAAQFDDDVVTAERMIGVYVKARPADPAGRALQTEIVCAIDLARCASILDTVKSTDDDETATARRLGAGLAGPATTTRARLLGLAKDADTIGSAAFADAYTLGALVREGGDPATLLVRSPRSGRPEPGPAVDLVRDARPISRLPFFTRVTQLVALGDAASVAAFQRVSSLFPTELATWRLARRAEKTALAARKALEKSNAVRWRVVAASQLAKGDEFCELTYGFSWTDRGPIATSTRVRCEIASDAARGRKIADARLAVSPYGLSDVEAAIDGELAVKDAAALEALARQVSKVAASSSIVATALWAAADAAMQQQGAQGAKKAHALYAEALAHTGHDPVLARRLLRKYVDAHDVTRAKLVIPQALVEAPLDAYLCGVEGEILLHEGKPNDALPWLTKSCLSARARKEQDILASTLATIAVTVPKSKDKGARDAAIKCAKGD